jgi:hypothetical protein
MPDRRGGSVRPSRRAASGEGTKRVRAVRNGRAPADLDFGSLPGGPDTAVIQLRNDGAAAGTVDGTIAPPLFQLVGNPFPLTLTPGAGPQVTVRALDPGASGPVTAFLKLTWEPGRGSLDAKPTATWS